MIISDGDTQDELELVAHAEKILDRWLQDALHLCPFDLSRMDCHCHLGLDSDGSEIDVDDLYAQLDQAGVKHATVIALHHSEGYAVENARMREIAQRSNGRLHALHRCDPRVGDVAQDAHSGILAGAKGLKWHPRAEAFSMQDSVARKTAQVAHEAGVPILIHAGRGMDRLGEGVVDLAREYSDATFILAHAAISDLAWIVEATQDVENIVFDTSWWRPTDLAVLLASCDPKRVLFGSDPPYGTVPLGLMITARIARACGWDDHAVAALMGGNARRIFRLESADDSQAHAHDAHMPAELAAFRRASELLGAALYVIFSGADAREVLELAVAALDRPKNNEHADSACFLQHAIRVGFTLYQTGIDAENAKSANKQLGFSSRQRLGVQLLMGALVHASTPLLPMCGVDGVQLPDLAPFV